MTTRAKIVLAVALMLGAVGYVAIPMLAGADQLPGSGAAKVYLAPGSAGSSVTAPVYAIVEMQSIDPIVVNNAFLSNDAGTYIRDGGTIYDAGSHPVNTLNPMPVAEQVPYTSTLTCLEQVANTGGDGGVLSPTAGALYELIVDSSSAVRMANGIGCTSFTGGNGQVENESTDKYFRPKLTPDGGVPKYTLCAETAATGKPKVQMCPVTP
jgi:hypothetical protein